MSADTEAKLIINFRLCGILHQQINQKQLVKKERQPQRKQPSGTTHIRVRIS